MVCTVTLNPALDYVMQVHSLDAADIIRTQSEQIYYGGKGINVSAVLTRLGIENKALGFLAGFSGRQLEELLTADGIDSNFVYLSHGNTRINVKIRAEREIGINARGPEITPDDTKKLMDKLETLCSGDILVLSGSVPETVPDDIYERILKRFYGRDIRIAVDAAGSLLLNVLKYKPFLIKPNHHELGALFGAEVKTLDDVLQYGGQLQKLGARNVLVSRGEDGAVLLDENGGIHVSQNARGRAVGTVGCGDSMVAGFIAGWLKKRDYEYALKLGTACGNAAAFSGALPQKTEIDGIMSLLI